MNKTILRSITGVGFVVLTISCLIFCKYLFAAYFIAAMVLMMNELFRMGLGSGFRTVRLYAILTAVFAFILVFCNRAFGISPKYISLAVFPLMGVMCYSMFAVDKSEFPKMSIIYAALLYIALPVILSNFIVFDNGIFSGRLIILFFAIVWCSDVGAYVFGMGFGQKPDSKKLCPEISPKKSWWGFWGGLAFAVAGAVIMKLTGLWDFSMVHSAVLGAFMSITGVLGDLFESQWKRSYGFKDSGNVIPGHGGMLDRFDSAIFAFTGGAVYLALFGLI